MPAFHSYVFVGRVEERTDGMEAYLDHAATTYALEEVAELVKQVSTKDFGNPSSKHRKGIEAENILKEGAERIAKTLRCAPKNVIFTSGGTESNNTAIMGTVLGNRRRGKHIVTTGFEHSAIYKPLEFLKQYFDCEITYLPVDEKGHVSPADLKDAIREDTVLVSVMMVNNEIGSKEDVETLANVVKKVDPKIVFHTDAIQAYGKYQLDMRGSEIDLLSVSGHKIHGPKGTGFLYVKDHTKVLPLIYGGGQQRGFRSGTDNVPGVAGLGLAAERIYENHKEKTEHLYDLKQYTIGKLLEMDGVQVNGMDLDAWKKDPGIAVRTTAPHVISVGVDGVQSEVFLHALEDRGVYVSSGSACSSNQPGLSSTLQAIGLDKEMLYSTIRLSFCFESTREEVDYALEQMRELIPFLRRYTRK